MEVAFNVVDATAVVLPPPDIVETLELDSRVLAFDLVDSDEDETCQVVTAVEPADVGARHSGTFAVLTTDVDGDLDSPSLVDALEFDLIRTDHEEVLVQSIVVDDDNFFLDTEDNEVSGVGCTIYTRWWQPHTGDFNVSCLHTGFGCKC